MKPAGFGGPEPRAPKRGSAHKRGPDTIAGVTRALKRNALVKKEDSACKRGRGHGVSDTVKMVP